MMKHLYKLKMYNSKPLGDIDEQERWAKFYGDQLGLELDFLEELWGNNPAMKATFKILLNSVWVRT
jgi:hypothetical protein